MFKHQVPPRMAGSFSSFVVIAAGSSVRLFSHSVKKNLFFKIFVKISAEQTYGHSHETDHSHEKDDSHDTDHNTKSERTPRQQVLEQKMGNWNLI